MNKNFKLFISLALASAMALSFATGCNPNNDNPSNNNSNNGGATTSTAESFVSLDINPEIELTVDENDIVISAYGANEDGQIVLHGETEIVGKDIEVAIDKITEIAVDLGYLSEDNKVVNTSVSSKDDAKAVELEGKINAKIKESGLALGLDVKTTAEGAFSLMREYENFLAEHPELQEVLSVKKFKLALSASETGEITLEAAVELDEEDLIDLIKDAHDELENYATEKFKKARKEAKAHYDKAVDLLVAGVYDQFYAQNIANHPITGMYYGKLYQAYKTAEISLDMVNDLVELAYEAEDEALNDDVVNAVVAKLGVSTDVLKNADGEITIESIENYIDKYIKNADENEDLDTLEDELEEILDKAENIIETNFNLSEYLAEVEAIKTQFNTLKSTLEGVNSTITIVPETVINNVDSVIADVESALADGLTLEELEDLEEVFEDASEEVLDLIEEALSNEELQQVKEMINSIKASAESYKTTFDQAIATAKNQARNDLDAMKQYRKDNFAPQN